MAKVGFSHESHKNVSVDWYTPKWVFNAMGLGFDLDPCSPAVKVPWIPAGKIYTETDDGLTKPWEGRVWLNPPYGGGTPAWLKKMHEHRYGVALVFSRTDCGWFHDFVANSDAVLFLKGRVKFVDGLGVTGGSGPGSGSLLAAWSPDCVEALASMGDRGFGKFIRLS